MDATPARFGAALITALALASLGTHAAPARRSAERWPAPTRSEASSTTPSTSRPARIDPSVASAEALETLRGIGPAIAQRIVDDRARHGAYRSAADLQRVPGIGPATVARLAPMLRFGGATASEAEGAADEADSGADQHHDVADAGVLGDGAVADPNVEARGVLPIPHIVEAAADEERRLGAAR